MSTSPYNNFVKAGVLAIFAIQFEMSLTTPALGAIASAFPDVNPTLVQMIASLPYLITIFSAPFSAYIVRVKSLRFALNIGMITLFIGGILPGLFGDFYFILACRVLFGFGYGFMFNLGPSVVNSLFHGRERDNMLGYQSAVGSVAGIIYGMIGGFLAGLFWRYAFLGFIIMIPLMVLVMAAVPNPQQSEKKEETVSKDGVTGKTWLYAVLIALAYALIFSWISNTAMVVVLEKIGTSAQAGLVMSIFTIGCTIGGLTFGKLSDMLKRYHSPFCLILCGIGIFIAYFASSMIVFYISGFIFGIAFVSFACRLYVIGAESAPNNQSLGISYMVSASCVGQFVSPLMLAALTPILGFSGLRASWLISWPMLILVGIVMTLLVVMRNRTAEAV
ncbi:MFS transporter [Dehalobacter sp. DCM]|uniref:MFS transporter n=1 Tax=Dehalobacter sp. DCM TaxID=2907827 RepID=UPI003081AFAF|nr:MFS transporter [Dehalobacter sp. DCM]